MTSVLISLIFLCWLAFILYIGRMAYWAWFRPDSLIASERRRVEQGIAPLTPLRRQTIEFIGTPAYVSISRLLLTVAFLFQAVIWGWLISMTLSRIF